MTDPASLILEKIAAKSTVRPAVGVFVSWDAQGPVVDIGDGRIVANFATSYLPEVNERVQVWFVDGVPFVMGPVTPRPSSGTVTAVASNLVTLNTTIGSVGPIPYVGSAPVVGDVMRLLWNGGALAIMPAAPPPPPKVTPTTPSPPAATEHVDTFQAGEAGTWNTGGGDSATSYFNSEVWASSTTIGFWFYGSKIADTIPNGAPIRRVQLYIAARQIQGNRPVFTTHGRQWGPGTSLSGGVEVGVSNYTWVDLPLSFGDALRRGGGSFGIGTRHGGYNIFKSLAADGQSGALRITSVY